MSFAQKLKAKSLQHPNIAYAYALIGYSAQAFAQILFKYVTHIISSYQALFLRGILMIIINTYLMRKSNLSPYISKGHVFKLIITRLVFSTFFAVSIYSATKYLPNSTVSSLSNTSPIFIFFIEAVYFKKKGLNKANLMMTIISFIGIILVIKPDFIFAIQGLAQIQGFVFHSILVLMGAFSFAMTMIFIHQIAYFKIDTLINLQYSYIGQLFVTAMMANFSSPYVKFQQLSAGHFIAFLFVVICSMIAQYGIFTANSLKKPSDTMPFGYVGVLISFLSDTIFFKIEFDFLSIIGMILTSVGLLSKYLIRQGQKAVEPRTKSYCIQDFYQEQISPQQININNPKI